MCRDHTFAIELAKGRRLFFASEHYDACSIHTRNLEDGDFNGGILTVRKSNIDQGPAVDINTVPVTITAPGMKDLSGADWYKARYLVLEVTTSASSATTVSGVLSLKKLGFNA